MTYLRYHARLAALATAVALIISCDGRNPVAPCVGADCSTGGTTPVVGSDNTAPAVDIALATGNTTADTIVYIGGDMRVGIVATDVVGVQTLSTTMRTAVGTSVVDSVTFNPTVTSVTRAFTINAATVARGERLVFTTRAADASANPRLDSLAVTVADTATPIVTVASKINGTAKGLDSIDVALVATDAAGIDSAGFRLLRVRGVGDTVVVFTRSSRPPARSTSYTVDFGFRISDTLPIGQYLLAPFAADRSGLVSRNPAPYSFSLTDATRPQVTILSPVAAQRVAVGAVIRVTARLTDNAGLARVVFGGYSQRGDSLLGTDRTVVRYADVTAPASGTFPLTRDTTITRDLQVVSPIDSIGDTLYVTARVTDVSGLQTSVRVPVLMTNGPRVTLVQPTTGDSLTRGELLTISVSALSTSGVASLGFALSDSGFPTSVAQVPDTVLQPASSPNTTVTYSRSVLIPANADGVLTITPRAVDVNGQPGAATPFRIAVRRGAPPVPLVHQSIAPRIELVDSITITASGTGLRFVGYTIRDFLTNAVVDSAQVAASASSFGPRAIPFRIATQYQGTKVKVSSFAIDNLGRIGYAVPQAVTTPQAAAAGALSDTSLVVYGQTYSLPTTRTGTIADLVVDPVRGNVFMSNINQGRLEVWRGATKSFDATGIIVGSQPWGMTLSRTAPAGDTLYVANSGGTNLSRVYIGPGTMREDAANRILTRISPLFAISEIRETGTGRLNISVTGPIIYSDRPQYVQQAASGKLYVSTRPTPAAPTGTLRYLDPAAVAPDYRFLLSYANASGVPTTFAAANLDGAAATQRQPANDAITLCDHNSGTLDPTVCVTSTNGLQDAITMLRAAVPGTDVEVQSNVDIPSLGFRDTTFVAASGDGQTIAFGEGNRAPTARTILLKDDGINPPTASPSLYVSDLINNASDQVFGIALDSTGRTLGVHGNESYFALVQDPFQLRLQGKRTTFAQGAGIAFHPRAKGVSSTPDTRLAFVASNNGTVEAIDIAYYDFNRGTLATKFNLTGPLRVSQPFPGDPANVVLKLFGISPRGLVIIDVTAADLIAGP